MVLDVAFADVARSDVAACKRTVSGRDLEKFSRPTRCEEREGEV